MKYIKRITDSELQQKPNSSGAVLIRGAKLVEKPSLQSRFRTVFWTLTNLD